MHIKHMDTTRTREIIEAFGHDPYQVASTGAWTCDHRRCGDDHDTREDAERACLAVAGDQCETEMLADGSHPSMGGGQ